ncbi:PP0621 family protein [Thiomicrospira pelophila]|uniref:PP0621 family protein n=1 Tax=Thiomicrospira pelophila TaxID=934 RepID=UPI00068A14D1|nr:PP0621 family protein [Thiomicrospira pelophila]
MQAVLFLAFVLLIYFLIRLILNLIIEAREKTQKPSKTEPLDSQLMVRCARCGIHLPQSEAYFDGTHTYCSEGHMKAGPKLNPNETSESKQAETQETES